MPIRKYKDQRVAVLLDMSNMYHAARHFKARLNFNEVLKTAVAGRKLIRAVAYAVETGTKEEKAFFNALEKSGFEVKLKQLQVFYGGKKKGDWDVGIAIDAIRMMRNLDVIILVTGDGDYVPLVEYLQNHGQLVEAMAFQEGASAKLVAAVDDYVDLSADKNRYLIKSKKSASSPRPSRPSRSSSARPPRSRTTRPSSPRPSRPAAPSARS